LNFLKNHHCDDQFKSRTILQGSSKFNLLFNRACDPLPSRKKRHFAGPACGAPSSWNFGMRKARNYKEEHQRRKLRKLRLAGKPAEKFDYVVQRVRAGDSVTEARKKVGLSHGAFKRQ
jgi:hypothetical protein